MIKDVGMVRRRDAAQLAGRRAARAEQYYKGEVYRQSGGYGTQYEMNAWDEGWRLESWKEDDRREKREAQADAETPLGD